MTPALSSLLVYSAQVLLVIAAAAVAARMTRIYAPNVRLWFWRATLTLCLLLPLFASAAPGPAVSVSFGSASAALTAYRAVAPAAEWSAAIMTVVIAGAAARLLWIGVGLIRLAGLRRTSTPASLAAEDEALRQALAPRARVHFTQTFAQPVTFGVVRPVILLPARMVSLEPSARRTVLCHELVHVARVDWAWILAENVVGAALWFHPAVWWLLDQLQASREQVVDRAVVRWTGARKAYMEALLWFAETPTASLPASAFLHRRHLRTRLRHLAEEAPMRRVHLLLATLSMILLTGGGTAWAIRALPLDRAALGFAQASPARLEIRLAETSPGSGLVAVAVGGNGQVYLHAGAVLTTADVVDAQVVDAGGGRFSVQVRFTNLGSRRMAAATRAHVGRPVAIVLDGVVLAAPVVRSAIGESALLTGDFSRAQAEAIVERLPPRRLGAQLQPAPWADFGGQPAAAAQDRPFTAKDEGVVLPSVVSERKPVYTQAAKEARVQGIVGMATVVTADGRVGAVRVTKSLDTQYGLDRAAVAAMRLWRFEPGTKDGRPVPVQVDVEMRFTLK
jgi:TonB family protein